MSAWIESVVLACPFPPSIVNGKIKAGEVRYLDGDVVLYRCNDDLKLVGNNRNVCERGRWKLVGDDLPRCERSGELFHSLVYVVLASCL